MYLKEFENVTILLNIKSQISKWSKKLNTEIKTNDINVHWSHLKTTKFRTQSIQVMCDDCKTIHKRRIRDLDPNINVHYCKFCVCSGERNIHYGKPASEKAKEALKKRMEITGNPFTWDEVKKKIKEKNPWEKTALKNIGKKRSIETKEKMSIAAINAFKTGTRKPNNKYGKVKTRQFKNIDYQSKYELRFLKYVDKIGKLDLLERGPKIQYFDENGNEHNYYIDYKIKNTNIVFEIKSKYIWDKYILKNNLKKEAAEKIFVYYLIIDNNFNILIYLFDNYETSFK